MLNRKQSQLLPTSEEIVEKPDEPTPEEIGEVYIQLRRLSPDISINLQVRSAIRLFWHNVPSSLARVKSAPGRALDRRRHRPKVVQATNMTIRAGTQQ